MPSPTAPNGRESSGKFGAGNHFGRGNPHAKRVGELRTALLDAVTTSDFREAATAILTKAKAGDVAAFRELADRCLGRPTEADLIARVEELEATIAALFEGKR